MNRNSKVYDTVVDLLYEMQAAPSDVVTRETRLHHDLQMDGDDAIAFFDAICERRSIDWSGFEFGRHFLGECEVSSPIAWIGRRLFPEKRQKLPITVGHLVSVIEARRWWNPNEAAV